MFDPVLSARMALIREIAALGRRARSEAKIKIRQPLPELIVILQNVDHLEWLIEQEWMIRDEVNVKRVKFLMAKKQEIRARNSDGRRVPALQAGSS